MAQIHVGNVAHKDPADFELTLPLVGRPDGAAPRVVDLVVRGIISV